MSETPVRYTEHYAVNLAYCNCGERLIDDHVRRARAEEVPDSFAVALARNWIDVVAVVEEAQRVVDGGPISDLKRALDHLAAARTGEPT